MIGFGFRCLDFLEQCAIDNRGFRVALAFLVLRSPLEEIREVDGLGDDRIALCVAVKQLLDFGAILFDRFAGVTETREELITENRMFRAYGAQECPDRRPRRRGVLTPRVFSRPGCSVFGPAMDRSPSRRGAEARVRRR